MNVIGRGKQKGRPFCTHCKTHRHSIERCYKLHGYPLDIRSDFVIMPLLMLLVKWDPKWNLIKLLCRISAPLSFNNWCPCWPLTWELHNLTLQPLIMLLQLLPQVHVSQLAWTVFLVLLGSRLLIQAPLDLSILFLLPSFLRSLLKIHP